MIERKNNWIPYICNLTHSHIGTLVVVELSLTLKKSKF